MNGFTPGVLYARDRVTFSCLGLEVKLCHIGPCLHVVVFVFSVPTTAKVIWRRGHGLKSHPTHW